MISKKFKKVELRVVYQLLEGFSNDDIPIKIYRACAEIEPSLMVEMQQLKLEGIV